MTDQPVKHRSVSQESSYSDCGLRYKLERLDGHAQSPAWWNVGGHAFHYAIEWWERMRWEDIEATPSIEDTVQVYVDAFATEMVELEAVFPDVSSWRAAKKGAEGKDWWLNNGAGMVERYVRQNTVLRQAAFAPVLEHQARDAEILGVIGPGSVVGRTSVHDIPALELPFMLDVDGVMVKGFIDQAFISRNGDVRVQDLKSGARWPTDSFQLGVYAHALERCYGVPCRWGSYYQARQAATKVYDVRLLHPWDQLVYRFHTMDRAENAGIYLPRVSSFCVSCGVRSVCPMHVPEPDPFLLEI